jgi:hypothetical protein
MQYWKEEISAQLSLMDQEGKQVLSIFLPGQSIPINAYKHPSDATYDNRNLQEFTGIITPPRKATNNLGPPPLNKIRRIMDKNNLGSLDPSTINYQDYSPPPTPSRPPLKMRNTRTDQELSHLNKSVIQNPHDSHIQIINTLDESIQDDSNKENIPPRQFKQERKPVISPLVFKVMARDTRTIITDDKSIDYGRATSRMSQNSRNELTDETRTGASSLTNKEINTVEKLYLNTKTIGEGPTIPTMSSLVGGPHPEPVVHPHVDIGSSHILRNPLINAELRPMSLTITSPNARITEFSHNPNILDSFFAKIYLPYSTLTGYRNGHIQTAEGRAYLCLHFNGNDPRVFGLASFNAPDFGHDHDSAGPAAQPPAQAAATQSHVTPPSHHLAQPSPQRASGRPTPATSSHGSTIPHASTFYATIDPLTPDDPLERPSRPPPLTDNPTPALFFCDRNSGLNNPVLFGSISTEQDDLPNNDDSRQYTPAEWLFLTDVVRYFKGAEDLRQGLVIPNEFRQGEYLEGIGENGQVSLRLPFLESLFLRAGRTWPTSVFNVFASNNTVPFQPFTVPIDTLDYLDFPTPSSTIDDTDELASTDEEWMYPPTPPRLPPIELPLRQFEDLRVRSSRNSPDTNPNIDAREPVHANLNPFSANTSDKSKASNNDGPPRQTPEPSHMVSPPSVDDRPLETIPELTEPPSNESQPTYRSSELIPELDELPHPTSPPLPSMPALDNQDDMDIEFLNSPQDTIAPETRVADSTTGMTPSSSLELTTLSTLSLDTPPTSPEPSEAQVDPTTDSSENLSTGWTADDWSTDAWDAWGVLAPNEEPTTQTNEESWYPDGHPSRSYPQQTSADEMRRTLSQLTTHLLPLTTIRFGSRMSYRTIGRLREAIPQPTFIRLFRDFGTYENLADSICTSRDNHGKVPNRWQAHLSRLRRIRQLATQYIKKAETLLQNHGFIDGLKDYADTHDFDLWHTEKHTGSLFYPHELEYFHALHQFLIDESYFDLAYRTRQLLTCTFEQATDLWTIVFTILGRLEPPTFDFQINADFKLRTDKAANQKKANSEQHRSLEWPQI